MTITFTPREATFSKILIDNIMRVNPRLAVELDIRIFMILAFIRDDLSPGSGTNYIRSKKIMDALNISRYTLLKLLPIMATLRLIRVTHVPKTFSVVEINPEILPIIDPKGRKFNASDITEIARKLINLMVEGDNRGDFFTPLQGFHSHVEFGEKEPSRVLSSSAQLGSILYQEAKEDAKKPLKQLSDKEQQKKEKFERAKMANTFISRCANIWMGGQIMIGRMKATDPVPPSWYSPDYRSLSEGDKKKYNILATHFLRYGTVRIGLAWAMFCIAKPANATFEESKKRPYANWVSDDKNPSSFDKHLMSILTDEYFQADLTNPATLEEIRSRYGDDLFNWNGDENLPMPGGAK